MAKNTVWVEKYRPTKLSQLSGQVELVKILRSLDLSYLPHLLFYGPPGTGKTTVALALCRKIYGPSYRKHVLELNASDDRGIGMVRSKIKLFSQQLSSARYKVVILDEADSMTKEAQGALRRVIEKYSLGTRFIIICNYLDKMSTAIVSRCSFFFFQQLSPDQVTAALKSIFRKETSKELDAGVAAAIAEKSEGDLRNAIVELENFSVAGSGEEFAELHERQKKRAVALWGNLCLKEREEYLREVKEFALTGESYIHLVRKVLEEVIGEEKKACETFRMNALLELGSLEASLVNGCGGVMAMVRFYERMKRFKI